MYRKKRGKKEGERSNTGKVDGKKKGLKNLIFFQILYSKREVG